MRQVVNDAGAIAFCGLYCGACKRYLKGGCPGCQQNEKASWCKVRTCCLEQGYRSCTDCLLVSETKDCTKLHNFFSNVIGVVLNSDRDACLAMISDKGYEGFAEHMATNKLQTLPRRR